MRISPLMPGTAGIILAGGASSRFGANKALAEFRGRALIEHAVGIFNRLFRERLLITGSGAEYEFLHWPSVADIFPNSGPLAGIHAGLKNISCKQAFVTACDMPLLDERLIAFLCNLPGSWDAALPWLDRGPEPLYAVYRQSCLPVIESNLAAGQRKISRMLAGLKVRKVELHELRTLIPDFTPFYNINRPADLNCLNKALSLSRARKSLTFRLRPGGEETVSIQEALGRVTACNLRACLPVPHFPQARMDGFAVRDDDLNSSGAGIKLRISTEIAAGRTDIPAIARGEAARIMTGGHLPEGGGRVVPQEECREEKGYVRFKKGGSRPKYIRKTGGEIRAGQLLVKKGAILTPSHLHRLAAGSLLDVPVFRKVTVAILSTGSELVEAGPRPGQVISANRILLAALLRQAGALPLDLGLIKDKQEEIMAALKSAFNSSARMVITTGGMGPGKFDLVGRCLELSGVETVCRGINIRPGGTTLLGIKGNIAVIALPGPPPTVQTLFYELVRPALEKLQGLKNPACPSFRAELGAEILINKKEALNLKGGWLVRKSGAFVVAPAGPGADVNCVIHIPANRRLVRQGEEVTVQPFCCIMG